MAVPFGSLIPQRSRVLPQGGAVLGQLTGTFQAGLEQGRMRAAEEQAPDLLLNYLETQGQGYGGGGTLGNLAAPATGYVGGQQAPQFNGMPTQANAELQTALTPGSETFDGRFALRRTNAEQQNQQPPAPTASAISYNFGDGTIRNQPVSSDLERVLNTAAAAAGIDSVVINSGGQAGAGTGGPRTGSTRHDHGGAADLQLVVGGRALDFTNPNDLPIIQSFIAAARANGATGFGAGTDYMGNNTLHVGFGNEAVWGAGGSSATAPEWLSAAVSGGGPSAPMTGGAPSGGMPATGGGYSSQPAWSPPTGAERAQLRALMINPATRQMGYQLAVQRMTPPEPVQPNWQLQEFNGTLYRIDANTGQAQPVIQGQPSGPEWQPFTDPVSGWSGRRNAAGDIEWNPEGMQPQTAETGEPPTDVQIYDYYVQQETRDGRTPKSFNEWDLERRGRLGGIDPSVAEQRYNLLYQNAARELPILEETWASLGDLGNQAAERLPAIIGNWIVTPDYQRALSAMTQVVQMQTYALTGAAATNPEAERIARTLLPAIGDGPQVIADKLQRTRDAIAFIRGASGTAGTAPVSPPPAAPPPTAAPLAPGEAPDPTVIWQWDPTTNTLVPVSPR